MKSAGFLGLVVVMLSCHSFFQGSSEPSQSAADPVVHVAKVCKPCPLQEPDTALSENLEQCEAQVVTLTKTNVKVKHVPVEKIVKRKCANDGPVIQAVPSTKCMTGQLCLDDEGQRVLAKNMAAYEAWVQQVQDCEAK